MSNFIEKEKLNITIPALAKPTLEDLKNKFSWIKSIERDISPTEEVTLKLGTVLLPDEAYIGSDEYERRRDSLAGQFGYQQLNWLVENQDEHPAFKALLGEICIDGTGLMVGTGRGRVFPALDRDGERWHLRWDWAYDGIGRNGRIAFSCKSDSLKLDSNKNMKTTEEYHNLILSLVASATIADHMGDMWDDIDKVLEMIGEEELTEDRDELPKLLNERGIKTVWGTEVGEE